MLIQFNFSNYKSFRDEVSLDLSAAKMTEHNERVVTIGKEKVLRAACIYGANAGGKSCVYEAFDFMTEYVISSLRFYSTGTRSSDEDKNYSMVPVPFLFDRESVNKESSFEVFFAMPGDITGEMYNYGFCVDENGVTEEWLNKKNKTAREYRSVFYREKEQYEFHGFTKLQEKMLRQAISEKVLLVSLGAQLNIEICRKVRDWFYTNECADYADLSSAYNLYRTLPGEFIDDSKVQEDVVRYFSSFDRHIKGFDIKEIPSEEEKDPERKKYFIGTKHKIVGSKEYAMIPLEWESAGTLKMFSLYSRIHSVLEKGGVFFVDELNARLHPLLVRNIILAFLNPSINTKNAQIIFTSHDTWQLSNQFLRRDEIWLVDKNADGVSSLYSLADFETEDGAKIRKDENYEKNYLLGKYGAIPELTNIFWKEEASDGRA